MSKISRIKTLVEELNMHRDAYYNDSVTFITDKEYDDKFDELENLFSSVDNSAEHHNKAVSNAKKYIDEHISEKLSLKIIAENVYMSTFHLSRTFKKCYGVNISEYILSERVNRAKQYLATSDFAISEIMRMSGFDDNNSYFYQIFKKHTGITPAEYRKMFRG